MGASSSKPKPTSVSNPPSREVDVLIVGGGPVGLLTAYGLHRFTNTTSSTPLRILTIEKHLKSTQDSYGRAITLYPRSTELLDQLDLADELAQACFACRTTSSFNASGAEVQGRGWAFMESKEMTSSLKWGFALVLRQRWQEVIYRRRLKEVGGVLESGVECTAVEEIKGSSSHKLLVTVKNTQTGVVSTIKCKHLVGADGGRSFIRRTLDIPFDGTHSTDKWVRIDGIVETNMPKPRSYGSIESPTHGNVLWAPLDHGATRIGFAFPSDRAGLYKDTEGGFDEAAAVAEAIESVKPFTLSFTQVDWWTIYEVGQRVARKFYLPEKSAFLVGDAAHTHSSGAAQGLNTGILDTTNLSWKLALTLTGYATPALLPTYDTERRPIIEHLIHLDSQIAPLMTNRVPDSFKNKPTPPTTGDQQPLASEAATTLPAETTAIEEEKDPDALLGTLMREAASFTSGLGISYPVDGVLNKKGSFMPLPSSTPPETVLDAPPTAGTRAPDVPLLKPATKEVTRLHKETPNVAKFYIVLFAGDCLATGTRPAVRKFIDAVAASKLVAAEGQYKPVDFLTLSTTYDSSTWELLGGALPPPGEGGKMFFDTGAKAHARFGVDPAKGAVFVLRPDGWVGTAVTLGSEGKEAVEEVSAYLGALVKF